MVENAALKAVHGLSRRGKETVTFSRRGMYSKFVLKVAEKENRHWSRSSSANSGSEADLIRLVGGGLGRVVSATAAELGRQLQGGARVQKDAGEGLALGPLT
jgi:hypothetical protein